MYLLQFSLIHVSSRFIALTPSPPCTSPLLLLSLLILRILVAVLLEQEPDGGAEELILLADACLEEALVVLLDGIGVVDEEDEGGRVRLHLAGKPNSQ